MIGLRGVVAAAAVVAVVVVVRGGSHRRPPAKAASEPAWPVIEAEEAPSTPTSVAVMPPTTTGTPAVVEDGAAGQAEGDAAAVEAAGEEVALGPADQWRALLGTDAPRAGVYRLIGDPASSDLPAAVAARAASTGSRFVVADVTGVGREAFAGWWAQRPVVPVAATARVLAAGAASYGPLVQVVVVWDGTAPDGGDLGARTTTVLLESPHPEVFVPVHPGETR